MAQSRNPSERNKVGEKQKKKQNWFESALDVAGDFATGLGKTTVGNISKVGEIGGNIVKGLAYDPVKWAMENPDEVAKTFVNPNRASKWLGDNLFAMQELERLSKGSGGLTDAAITAMALFPVGKIADDAVKAALSNSTRAAGSTVDEVIAAAERAAAEQGKNPFSALYSGVRGESRAKRNVMSAAEGARTGRAFETPVGTPQIDPNELDSLVAAALGDKSILEKGGNQYMDLIAGLRRRAATNEGRMAKILEPLQMLEDALRGVPKNSPEYRALLRARKQIVAEQTAKQKAAVAAENRFSNRR